MHTLAELQQAFQDTLCGKKSNFMQLITRTKKPSIKQRIHIYSDGYFSRLYEVLLDNYPKLYQYLGEHKFHSLAKKYLKHYPSTFRSIRWFGDKLPDFLEQNNPYNKRLILKELALFDWAVNFTFDALDAKVVTREDLKIIPVEKWGNMRFEFHPAVVIHKFSCNTAKVWNSLIYNQKIKPRKLKQPQAVLFWRNDITTFYRELESVESSTLQQALTKKTFTILCETIGNYLPEEEAPIKAAQLLIQWLNDGLINKVHQ